ncbi:pyocin knob domain-containing protein [Clostridium sp. AM58-1XD]|uniref:pyocin knob domain-containing protein n=1 Tax=Clostridium sp. AM58-1XD TaxID=2292307 RepID=UPI000E4B7AEC|nr:pyocin knob domain-containing protein [Clostridium sp. AM58-1XD]RGY98054.1 hypothetical protein DXA13_12170 [Clostridium sp. AM58-1XD]
MPVYTNMQAAERLSEIHATDTLGILGAAGSEAVSQALIDAIADRVVTKLIEKSQVVNNLFATEPGNVLDAVQGKALKDMLDHMNNSLSSKANELHTHDDRYYTESEISNLLSSYKKRYDGNISNGSGFNQYLTQGQYFVGSNAGTANGNPYNGYCWGILFIFVSDGLTWNGVNNWIWQIFLSTSGHVYLRQRINADEWSTWVTWL